MFNKTKITVVPAGYQPDLDRLPPEGAGGCGRGCMLILVFIVILGGLAGGAYFALAPKAETTTVYLPTVATLESTATHTATMDYCWFLTPTIEALPTIEVTLDQWQLKATDDRWATGTPLPTDLPTSEPPKAWCNEPPVIQATATSIATDIPRLDFDLTAITDTPEPTATFIPTAVPISTLFPTIIPRANNVQSVPSGSTGQGQVIVIQTVVVVKKDKVIKVVTATAQPTATPTATATLSEATEEPTLEPTETATDIPTIEPTLIPTVTPSSTLTPSPTLTATATATYTHTPTATYTATLIPTSTLFPTLIPTEIEATEEVTS